MGKEHGIGNDKEQHDTDLGRIQDDFIYIFICHASWNCKKHLTDIAPTRSGKMLPFFFPGHIPERTDVTITEDRHSKGIDRRYSRSFGGTGNTSINGTKYNDDQHQTAKGSSSCCKDLTETGPWFGRNLFYAGRDIDGNHQNQAHEYTGQETGHEHPGR